MDYSPNILIISLTDNYIVIDKPYDMLINYSSNSKTLYSETAHEKETVHTQLKAKLPHLNNVKLKHGFHFVHRLDYATSGLLCIGLNKKIAQEMTAAFANRQVEKYYIAIVRGHVTSCQPIQIDMAIGVDNRPNYSHRMCTSDKDYCIKPRGAQTRMLAIQLGFYDGEPATKLLLKPITGRRHQLRVHCLLTGHPIVGDYTYSDGEDAKPHRMFLHAIRLKIPLPSEMPTFTTLDPFQESDDANKWKVSQFNYQLDNKVYHLL